MDGWLIVVGDSNKETQEDGTWNQQDHETCDHKQQMITFSEWQGHDRSTAFTKYVSGLAVDFEMFQLKYWFAKTRHNGAY